MIIDDSAVVRRSLAKLLFQGGNTTVLVPPTLQEARDYLGFDTKHTPVEVLLLDVIMPEVDGLTFLGEVRSKPHLDDLSVIIVTSIEEERQLAEAIELGANDYLTKPPLPVVLNARVRNAQRYTRAMRMLRKREEEANILADRLKEANDQLRSLSFTDTLTNLSNRRAFDDALQREQQISRRTESHLGLLMIDIDHFKWYNDHYGHIEGDTCLQKVASALCIAAKRTTDVVARYGGEEFAILLPGTDSKGVSIVADLVLKAIRDMQIEHERHPLKIVTVSIGGTSTQGTFSSELMRLADQALYDSKHNGRNQFTLVEALEME